MKDLQSEATTVSDAVATRRSLRAFLPDTVDLNQVKEILTKSSRAPSGTNMQPWQVHLLSGHSLKRVSEKVLHAYDNDVPYSEEQSYYPDNFFEPYLARRRKVGWDLYGLLGIEKGEKDEGAASSEL